MNLLKSQDYFNPINVKHRCHIIGCGSVGSTVAELLVRLGLSKITLYDFDTVSSHNLANQLFVNEDIGKPKTEALKKLLVSINPLIETDLEIRQDGWTPKDKLSGYVFLCVDNIDLRRNIATTNRFNQSIKAMFDFRTRLEDAQHFAADWNNIDMVDNLLQSMNFSHEEAHQETPLTACNVEMGVAPTVRTICSFGVANFMNFITRKELKKMILVDAFNFDLDAF